MIHPVWFPLLTIGPSNEDRLFQDFDLNRNISALLEHQPMRYDTKSRWVEHDLKIPELYPILDPAPLFDRPKTSRAQIEERINKFLKTME
jgi:hypothetical protein